MAPLWVPFREAIKSYMLPFINGSDLTGAVGMKRLSFTCTRLTQLQVNAKYILSIKVKMSTETLWFVPAMLLIVYHQNNRSTAKSKQFIVGFQRLRILKIQLHLTFMIMVARCKKIVISLRCSFILCYNLTWRQSKIYTFSKEDLHDLTHQLMYLCHQN